MVSQTQRKLVAMLAMSCPLLLELVVARNTPRARRVADEAELAREEAHVYQVNSSSCTAVCL